MLYCVEVGPAHDLALIDDAHLRVEGEVLDRHRRGAGGQVGVGVMVRVVVAVGVEVGAQLVLTLTVPVIWGWKRQW